MVKITMFMKSGIARSGLVLDDRIYDLKEISDELDRRGIGLKHDDLTAVENLVLRGLYSDDLAIIGEYLKADGDLREKYGLPLENAEFAPLLRPQMCHAIGMNYKFKTNRPMYVKDILKAGSSVCACGEKIPLPKGVVQTSVSAELCAIISKKTKNISSLEEAKEAIGGYTMGNDVGEFGFIRIAMDMGSTCKSLDKFAPMGPVVVSPDEVDPLNFNVRLVVNGVEKSKGNTRDAAFSIYEVIRDISKFMTLYPSDVIFLGAMGDEPIIKGPGDVVECQGENIGSLRNEFVSAEWSIPETYAKEFERIPGLR